MYEVLQKPGLFRWFT